MIEKMAITSKVMVNISGRALGELKKEVVPVFGETIFPSL